MADLLRMVTFDDGGRPVEALNLNNLDGYNVVQGSFTVAPGQKQQAFSSTDRRYGGSRQTAETHENGSIGWTALVKGDTEQQCVQRVEGLLAVLERTPGELFLEWRPDGTAYESYREIRGTATWTLTYEWAQFHGARSMVVQFSWPTEPLTRGQRMDVFDDLTADTRSDYTYDAGSASDERMSAGGLRPSGTLTTERRAIHTVRGYKFVDSGQQIKAQAITVRSFKVLLVAKRLDARNYIEAYVDDDGTNSRLRIDKVVAGTRTNLATGNLVARISDAFWLRLTVRGNAIAADYYTVVPPGPVSTSTRAVSYTLAGGEIAQFGAGVAGYVGRGWIPQDADAALRDYVASPHPASVVALPALINYGTPIPGTAPALVDIAVTPAATNAFALLAWGPSPVTTPLQVPFGVLAAIAASSPVTWASAAGGFSGAILQANVSSARPLTAYWDFFDPSQLAPDDFATTVGVEVWARVFLAPTLVAPTLLITNNPQSLPGGRGTVETGLDPVTLQVPTTPAWRFIRVGTLQFEVIRRTGGVAAWTIAIRIVPGGTGLLALDYLLLAPVRQRACSPTGVANVSGVYPEFTNVSGGVLTKTITSSLAGRRRLQADVSALAGYADHGLAGQLPELPPGRVSVLAKLSDLVPDDPTASGGSEATSVTAAVGMSVTPRWQMLRDA